ncbi:MAG: hypothetical protein ACRDTU_16005 [Micromonosporaceae bacterium]
MSRAIDFAGALAANCIVRLADGDDWSPEILHEAPDGTLDRALVTAVPDTTEAAIEAAQRILRSNHYQARRAALAFLGYGVIDGEEISAIIAEGIEYEEPRKHVRIAVPYRPATWMAQRADGTHRTSFAVHPPLVVAMDGLPGVSPDEVIDRFVFVIRNPDAAPVWDSHLEPLPT